MTEPTIICPKCSNEIRLTESLAAPLIAATRAQFEQQLNAKDLVIAKREALLREREKIIAEAQRAVEETVADRVARQLQSERAQLVAEETRKARSASAAEIDAKTRELTELQDVLKARDAKLLEAQRMQALLLRRERELEDARRELDLTVEKRISEGLGEIRSQAKREAEELLKHRVMEKDQTIVSMQRTIEELKHKAEQGSQQLQGEVLELALEALLRAKFPFDAVEPVPKGEFGGDILQRVVTATGQSAGAILWETKRTRNWSDGWLGKLREDQRCAKAEVCVLVSHALPKGVDNFDNVDGVWVTHPRCVLPIATILRESLVQIGLARAVSDGQHSKTELVYHYLTGPRFRQRVEAIVEAFSSMQEDLERERRVITKQWMKREEQIQRVMTGTVGMYGDLQGIAGKSLPEIDGLELRALALDGGTSGG